MVSEADENSRKENIEFRVEGKKKLDLEGEICSACVTKRHTANGKTRGGKFTSKEIHFHRANWVSSDNKTESSAENTTWRKEINNYFRDFRRFSLKK